MIRSAHGISGYPARVRALADNDPFLCRILSLYSSYPPELAFVDYWLTADDSGKTNGAIARNGSNFILFLTGESDLQEISSFLRLSGAEGVLCDGRFTLDFSGKTADGAILKRSEPIPGKSGEPALCKPTIKAAYDLIVKCTDDSFTPPAYDDFYVDVNHKLRHGAMRLYGIEERGTLAAVAMTVAESGDGAVLGAVACDPAFRRKGFGSKIVRAVSNALIAEGKTVFLHRAKNANAAFYQKLGFSNCGTWREYKI